LKSVVHGLVLFKDAHKRPITTILPSITTTHYDGNLPSPLSCALASNDPPLPSVPSHRLRHNLREQHSFQNDSWTKWEAVQLVNELEAKQAMEKAKWDLWKEAGKQWEALDLQINGPILFEWDDLSDEAL
jgi:hypothetical protein